MLYELPKNAEINLLDLHYKSDSFINGRMFKRFFKEMSEQAFAVNLEAQKGLGFFPMMFEEKNAYASIGYALHSLTPYVLSENPIKYKTKIKGESEDKNGFVDFWCAEKDFKFEAYMESKKLWLKISTNAKWEFDKSCNTLIDSAFDQIKRLKSAGVDKATSRYTEGAVFKVALFQIPIVYHPKFKPEEVDLESAPKHLEKLLADKLKNNMGLLLSVLDMRPFGNWEGEAECNPFNVLAVVVIQ